MNIWMYWENKDGSTKPAYLDLCYKTILKNSNPYNLILLNESNVKDYIPTPPFLNKIEHIAHKADYYRFHLLYKYGGIWLDSDTILLKSLQPLIDSCTTEFMATGEVYGKPDIGFMFAKKGSSIIKQHIHKMDRILFIKYFRSIFNRHINLEWTEIGFDILWPILDKYQYDHIDPKIISPVHWKDYEMFLSNASYIKDINLDDCYIVTLYNQMFDLKFKKLSKSELLNKNNLLTNIFKKTLAGDI